MDLTTGSHSLGDLQQLLLKARAGDRAGVEMMLVACRVILMAIARQELPDGPGREEEIRALVDRALPRVPAILAAFTGSSEGELYEELRREFFDQLRTLTAPPVNDPAASLPTTDHPQRRDSLSDSSIAGVQTVPGLDQAAPVASAGRIPAMLVQQESFEHVSEVAVGGMGVVYRAWQTRLKRWVALKCLRPECAADPDRLRRFRQEALLAAGLTEPGIVQVYDVLEQDGTPVLVLPYIDGCDLNGILGQRRQLRDGKDVPHPHAEALKSERDFAAGMLPFFDRVLDALVGLHGAGVLHRDLKPSNILVDKNGNGWLTDFGLARLTRTDAAAGQHRVMGTYGFMSPEQWQGGEDVDARTDVFAVGVSIYEALTLELPYSKTRITAATPPATLPSRSRRFLPPHLDVVLVKAIHPDRRLRYQTAADLRDDWQRIRKGQLPANADIGLSRRFFHVAGRRMSQVIAAAVTAVAVILAAILLMPAAKKTRAVQLTTDPPGAKVALVPLDPLDGTLRFDQALQPDGTSPVTLPRVPPGDYLVVVEVPGHGFHEVYRRVPEPGEARPTISDRDFDQTSFRERDGTVELPAITVPKSEVNRGMQFFPGGEFTMGSADYGPSFVPPHTRTVTPFYLDETEVTVAAYRNSPKSLPRELAALSPKDDEAIRFVNYYQAAACAERLGKRLPDEAEYEFAATNAGANRFPWGDASDKVSSWPLGPVGSPAYDRALASPAVCGLFSNVAEWTSSWHAPYPVGVRPPERMARARAQRVVRGAPTQVVEGKAWSPNPGGATVWDARFRNGIDQDKAYPGLGFRCARSFKPRFPQPPGGEKP